MTNMPLDLIIFLSSIAAICTALLIILIIEYVKLGKVRIVQLENGKFSVQQYGYPLEYSISYEWETKNLMRGRWCWVGKDGLKARFGVDVMTESEAENAMKLARKRYNEWMESIRERERENLEEFKNDLREFFYIENTKFKVVKRRK